MNYPPSDTIIVGEGHSDSMESSQERANTMEELAKILQIDVVEAHVLLRRYKWNMQEVINNFLDAGSDVEVLDDECTTPNPDKVVHDAASICGVSHEEARQLLKRHNGNLDATINEYFQSTNNNIKNETSTNYSVAMKGSQLNVKNELPDNVTFYMDDMMEEVEVPMDQEEHEDKKFVLQNLTAASTGVDHGYSSFMTQPLLLTGSTNVNNYASNTPSSSGYESFLDQSSRLPNYYILGTSSTSYALSSVNPKPSFPGGLPNVSPFPGYLPTVGGLPTGIRFPGYLPTAGSFPGGLPTVGSGRGKNSKRPTKRRGRNVARSDPKDEDATHLVDEDFVPEDEQEEEMGVLETYADYKPSKLKIGIGHPDPVVETASLASVLPPDPHYQLHLPSKVIEQGQLSSLQLESIVYACQQHENILSSGERAGFLIGSFKIRGDGAGVGKGRTIAGIIYENYICGRKKAIWVSVSSDLKYDSERDIQDIGAKMDVFPLNKLKYGKIPSSIRKGIIFSTYSSLIGKSNAAHVGIYDTRLKQLVNWCGKDFDGVIVFDECHRAKNLVPTAGTNATKTGLAVHELQSSLPKARIVYASATGASEPRNVAYMTRLGIWGPSTPFERCSDFINAVQKRGVGAMELVAMDLKLRGTYIARQLSFKGVTFKIEECALEADFIQVYDESVALWVELKDRFTEAAALMGYDKKDNKDMWAQYWGAHQRFFKYLCIATKVKRAVEIAIENVKAGKCVVIGLQSTGEARTLDQLDKVDGELNEFVSTAKGVLENLIEKQFPCKTRGLDVTPSGLVADETTAGPSNNLQKRKMEGQLAKRKPKRPRLLNSIFNYSDENGSDDEMSDASTVSLHLDDDVKQEKKELYTGYVPKQSSVQTQKSATTIENLDAVTITSASFKEKLERVKLELLQKVQKLGERLPQNVLDLLVDELGGPNVVAEMTGRKGRVVQSENGTITYESRAGGDTPLDMVNLVEKQYFMDGKKKIAIISEAASSGISLQSDKRARNTSTRVHITLELPWSADRAIQQFGRTHRSNQANLPEYVFLISDLAGEYRFASIVAKRLETLGALTHGDRRATETRDLSRFHIDTKYGKKALRHVTRAVIELEPPIVVPKTDYPTLDNFFVSLRESLLGVGLIAKDDETEIFRLEKDYTNMSRFLNRILGIPVRLQNTLFDFLSEAIQQVVLIAKRNGQYDMGIRDLVTAGSGGMKKMSTITYTKNHTTGLGIIELHHLLVQRGLSWEDAMAKYIDLEEEEEGFYLPKLARSNKLTATLVVAMKPINGESGRADDSKKYYIYRPNVGLVGRRETLIEIEHKWDLVSPERAKRHWEHQYDSSKTICTHAFWSGNCRARKFDGICEEGIRQQNYHILSGSVLMVWDAVEKAFGKQLQNDNTKIKVQILRVRDETLKIIGIAIPTHCVEDLISELEIDCLSFEREDFE